MHKIQTPTFCTIIFNCHKINCQTAIPCSMHSFLVIYDNADNKHRPLRPRIKPTVQLFGWLAPLHLPSQNGGWWVEYLKS